MVIIAKRIHLFPYRTQKLSSIAPKVVGGSLPARIGRCGAVHRKEVESSRKIIGEVSESGRRSTVGNRVSRGTCFEGSNPFLSIMDA